MKYKDFESAVIEWADKVGIYEQSTEQKQVKYGEHEVQEAIEADNALDRCCEVCDIMVFAINAKFLSNYTDYPISIHGEVVCWLSGKGVAESSYAIREAGYALVARRYEDCINLCMLIIQRLCEHDLPEADYRLKVGDILQRTISKLKAREGMMFDGKFTKLESMTAEQKAIYLAK